MVQVFIKRCFRILHFEALLFVVKSKWKKSSLEIFFVLFKFWKLWENFFTAFIPWIDLIKMYTNSLGRCQNVNPLSPNFTKWSNTLKLFVVNFPTNCLSVFGPFVGLALKGLIRLILKAWNVLICCHWTCLRMFLLSNLLEFKSRTFQEISHSGCFCKMELFAAVVNGFQLLNTIKKISHLCSNNVFITYCVLSYKMH